MNEKFFSLLFSGLNKKGLIEVRELEPITEKPHNTFLNSLDKIYQYNIPEDKDVWFGLYVRGFKKNAKRRLSGEAKNCLWTKALWIDSDYKTLETLKVDIHKAKIPYPSMIVSSGHGFHCYWILKEPAYETIAILRAIQKAIGSDPRAAEKARVLRFPGSYNCKEEPFKQCKIIEINNHTYSIGYFKKLFGITKLLTHKKSYKNVINYHDIDMFCVKQMLKGVNDGYRHFSLGRITKYFQREGYNRENVRQTILDWDQKNNPPLGEKEILNSFYKCWNENYKLLGCTILDIEKQAKLSLYCDKTKCDLRFVGSQLEFSKSFGLNNRIFNNYKSVTGFHIILYSILERHPEGLTTIQIDEKLINNTNKKSCMGKNYKGDALKYLIMQGFVKVVTGNKKAGIKNFYRFFKQGTFSLGYTIINNGAVNGAIDGRITKQQLKIYALLCKYAISHLAFPALVTISKETGLNPNYISMLITGLEKADYLKKHYSENKKGTSKLLCQLMV